MLRVSHTSFPLFSMIFVLLDKASNNIVLYIDKNLEVLKRFYHLPDAAEDPSKMDFLS